MTAQSILFAAFATVLVALINTAISPASPPHSGARLFVTEVRQQPPLQAAHAEAFATLNEAKAILREAQQQRDTRP